CDVMFTNPLRLVSSARPPRPYFSYPAAAHNAALPPFPPRRSSDLPLHIVHAANEVIVGGRVVVGIQVPLQPAEDVQLAGVALLQDRKSTRLNSSHVSTSYAVFCLKKKIAGTARCCRRAVTSATLST